MNKYDHEYYFVSRPMGIAGLPDLSPEKNTKDRQFRFMRQPVGSAPLVFINGAKDYQRKLGEKPLRTPPNILFDGSNPLVNSAIREDLLNYDVKNMYMHPAVYIHDDGKWFEDYWYITFTEALDCWDRKNSVYYSEPMTLGGVPAYEVSQYSLNRDVLDPIPLEERLVFQMGGTTDGNIVCHQKLSLLFTGNGNTGASVVKMTDFGKD